MTAALPGTSIIYEPKTEALEYAPLAVNLYRGCGHGCADEKIEGLLRSDSRPALNGKGIWLVRPDGYVACSANDIGQSLPIWTA